MFPVECCRITISTQHHKQQRELFGAFLGKGQIVIDGEDEVITHVVKRCFGLDYEITFQSAWSGIAEEVARKEEWRKDNCSAYVAK